MTRQQLKLQQLDILEANNREQSKILDPFAGGGAIPLEVAY